MLITTATSTDEAKRGATVAVLPVGSFEQHGDHLPLATDTIVACVIANQLAITYNLFLLPPVTMSCSHEHEGFEGTVSISSRTLIAIIDDVQSSLARSGIRYLVLVNGHGGNYVLSNIAQEANVAERSSCLISGSGRLPNRARARRDGDHHQRGYARRRVGDIDTPAFTPASRSFDVLAQRPRRPATSSSADHRNTSLCDERDSR